jgi:hypothetical protein
MQKKAYDANELPQFDGRVIPLMSTHSLGLQ